MDNQELKAGSFIYKGKKYTVQRIVKMKHPETREWIEAVEYNDWEVLNFYVREKSDFLNKFKPYYPED